MITLDRAPFAMIAVTLAKCIGNRVQPILSCVKLSVSDGVLYAEATNGDLMRWQPVPAISIESDLTVCVPADKLAGWLTAVTGDLLTMEVVKGDLRLVCGSQKINLRTMDAQDYPIRHGTGGAESWKIPTATIVEAMRRTFSHASQDPHRAVLRGVLVEPVDDKVVFVATDTHRMSHYEIDGPIGGLTEIVIPASLIAQLPSGPELTFSIERKVNRIHVTDGEVNVVCGMVSGQFPNWRRVMPEDAPIVARFDGSELANGLKPLMVIKSSEKSETRRMLLDGSETGIKISSKSEEFGNVEFDLECNADTSIQTALNGGYMLSAIAAFGSGEITMRQEAGLRPALFECGKDHKIVIMPMGRQ